ncbi:hypothetical protein CONLIGDRAFT_686645 [Coniochaeta ligniaria NRRL 30616]|uniref:Uncharacterized protein n=1 Tax=Coniochaeta ligniaria NRRL 30616 TaxID=1408157 RepID=A0A1J7I8F7_9PEZI|nr:hypothetical protein CONLIGDRAFT_686645 [Coniochaeta ligniaria NRRL 30616]
MPNERIMRGKLHASENGAVIPVADGDDNMESDTTYEMDLMRDKYTDAIRLVGPRQRVAKKTPDSMDVVKRAVASAKKDPSIDAGLLDLTSMSFAMRESVYHRLDYGIED